MNALVRYTDTGWEKLKALALDSVSSPHSRRAYGSALDQFLAWYRAAALGTPLSKALVNAYKAHQQAAGLSASTINVRLCALRKLATEAGRQRADQPRAGGQHRAGARGEPTRRALGELARSSSG